MLSNSIFIKYIFENFLDAYLQTKSSYGVFICLHDKSPHQYQNKTWRHQNLKEAFYRSES